MGYGPVQAGQRVTYASLLDVLVEVAECRVAPCQTARFPFVARSGEPPRSIHEFSVLSDNPDFDPGWAHIVKVTDGTHSPRYILEIRPVNVKHSQYGTYPIWIRWDKPGASQPAIGRCTLIIKPCVRLRGKPTFKTWPGGVITLSLENCGGVGIDISVSITHHGSSWSTGWEFELDTGDGPFKFKETFEPPADGRGGQFDLEVSAAGIPLIQESIRPNNFRIPLKHAIAAAVVLIGAAVGITLANVLPGHLIPQSISFTSQPSSPTVKTPYLVSARGGGSGNPVIFTINPPSAAVCSLSGSAAVTFLHPGTCVIDANQIGNDKYLAAPQAQQKITVTQGPTPTPTSTPTSPTPTSPTPTSPTPTSPTPTAVVVPSVIGQSQAQATSTLQAQGLAVTAASTSSCSAKDNGLVVSQDPSAGTSVAAGTSVGIGVCNATTPMVPSVIGQSQAQATSTLRAQGLTAIPANAASCSPADNGFVVTQDPAAGTSVPQGTSVTIYVCYYVP